MIFNQSGNLKISDNIIINKIIRSNRRTLTLKIEKNGDVVVKAPLRMNDRHIHEFVKKHAKWIIKKKAEVLNRKVEEKKYTTGEKFLFLGNEFELEIRDLKDLAIKLENGKFLLADDVLTNAPKYFELWYKRQAKAIFAKRLELYSIANKLSYNGFKVSGAESRWGSCSSKKRINLSWKLVLAPLEVVDYVIIHELAHTKEMNHGKKFWAIVESIQPDYKIHRKWLRDNGGKLEL